MMASRPKPNTPPARTGLEARVHDSEHLSLKLWLRLLATSADIEAEIRRRLRLHFGITLARFDYLAQLHRHPQGLRMNEISKNLMVTGGNVTGLTDQLETDGLVKRTMQADDRRAYLIALTPKGRKEFEVMARVHEGWVLQLLEGMGSTKQAQIYAALGDLRQQLASQYTLKT